MRKGVFVVAVALVFVCGGHALGGVFADSVESYVAGNTSGFWSTPASALGKPAPKQDEGGAWEAVLNPFSPHYEADQIVQVGEGGHIALRLAEPVVPLAGAAEIGVFTNVGLIDFGWPNGQAGNPASTFGSDPAVVEVSKDGSTWVALNGGAPILFDVPSNYYSDLPTPATLDTTGLTEANFGEEFTGSLSSFDGQNWSGVLGVLGTSAGGKWLDISGTGLDQVEYIRLSVLDDGDGGTELTFELDAVSVNDGAIGGGAPVPEPTSAVLLLLGAAGLIRRRR